MMMPRTIGSLDLPVLVTAAGSAFGAISRSGSIAGVVSSVGVAGKSGNPSFGSKPALVISPTVVQAEPPSSMARSSAVKLPEVYSC